MGAVREPPPHVSNKIPEKPLKYINKFKIYPKLVNYHKNSERTTTLFFDLKQYGNEFTLLLVK